MATTREVLTKWGFDVEHEKLDKVEKQLEGIKQRLEFLAAVEIIKGIFELSERFATFAEDLHIAAVSAGLTVEAFQKLAFSAGMSRVSQDELSGALARLTRHLYEARNGGAEAQKVFAMAGFTADQVAGFRTGADAMAALADKFQKTEDPVKKQAIAMQLMGRGSYNMVAFLSQGSDAIKKMGIEAEHLGVILSHDQVEALTEVEHSFQRMFMIVKAVAATFASFLAPSVKSAVDDFTKFYEVNKKVFEVNMRQWVYDVTYALGFLYEAFKFVTQALFDFSNAHPAVTRFLGDFIIIIGALLPVIYAVKKAFEFWIGTVNLLKWAMGPLTAEVAFLEAPIWAIVLAATAAVAVIHDLWALLHGKSFKDTWIGKLGAGIGDFVGFDAQQDQKDRSAQEINVPRIFKNMFAGIGRADEIAQAPGGYGPEPEQTYGPAAPGALRNYEMNAPITINVPHGSDHKKVAESVQKGVKEHLDEVYRRTQASLAPAMVR